MVGAVGFVAEVAGVVGLMMKMVGGLVVGRVVSSERACEGRFGCGGKG